MSAETRLRALLLASSAVSAIVATRIHPRILPQSPVTPAIVYLRVTGDHPVDQDGPSGPAKVRVQLDLYAQTPDEVTDLRDKVIAALNGYAGPGLQGVFSENDLDLYDDETKLHRASLDFMAVEAAA